MPLAPISLPPGVVKPATALQAKGRYWDANLIRWQAGKLQPVGGWERITSTPLDGAARAIFCWADNVNTPYGAIGTENKLYILEGSTFLDATPTGYVAPEVDQYGSYGAGDYGELLYGIDYGLVSITTASRTSNVVTITTADPHGFPSGMSVLIAGVTDSSFNGTFTITGVTSTTFTYAQAAANGSSSGGTAALPVADRRPQSAFYFPTFSWTFDNWGEDLLAVSSSDGRLLHWSKGENVVNEAGQAVISTAARVSNVVTVTTTFPHGYTTGDVVTIAGNTESAFNDEWTIATIPTPTTFTFADSGSDTTGTGGTVSEEGIPTNNRGVVVTQERHAVLFGSGGNSRRVAWSNREDFTNWKFADATSTAGYLDLETQSRIIMATQVREGVLLWTEDEAWLMRFVGLPYVYGIERIGFGCGLMAPRSFATFAGRCIWMGREGFWIYDGGYVKPLPCDVASLVFENIDPSAGLLYTNGSENNLFPEVWFWYPEQGQDCPNKYVIFNYAENWWSIGDMCRTAACGAGVFPYPIAGDDDGEIYYHENGWTAAGAPLVGQRYAESGALNLQQGNTLTFIRQALTDSGYGYNSTALTFYTTFTPEGAETTHGPYNPRADGYTDTRVTGRDFRVRLEATQDAEWSIGEMRLDLVPQGGRR
jgi:hypothetical protein